MAACPICTDDEAVCVCFLTSHQIQTRLDSVQRQLTAITDELARRHALGELGIRPQE